VKLLPYWFYLAGSLLFVVGTVIAMLQARFTAAPDVWFIQLQRDGSYSHVWIHYKKGAK
jgi:hypothetical protein